MPAVVAVDQQRHLAVALLGEIGRLLVLAGHEVHVHVVEGLPGERQHQADLVGRAGEKDAVEFEPCRHEKPPEAMQSPANLDGSLPTEKDLS